VLRIRNRVWGPEDGITTTPEVTARLTGTWTRSRPSLSRLGLAAMFGQLGEPLDPPVHHVAEAVREMVPVSPVYHHALDALAVVLAAARASAQVLSRGHDCVKELILELARPRGISALEQLHRPSFQFVVVDHGHVPSSGVGRFGPLGVMQRHRGLAPPLEGLGSLAPGPGVGVVR